ncbi:hypothetical protein Mapa_011827 [Marchantia paleacea]|nr:hypothetical protein Mapa_011827 [Marchantia paleacea]
MSQQKSLFSFYSRGGVAAKSRAHSQQSDLSVEKHEQHEVRGCREGYQLEQGRKKLDSAPQEQGLSKQNVLQSIEQRFVCREKVVKPIGIVTTESRETSLASPGNKRIRETEEKLICPVPSLTQNQDLQKRRKLLEALGADDGVETTGAWAEARAKFEWMTPSKIRDAEKRRPCHPAYDERTLLIPNDVFHKFSASQKQYWTTKCKYMDTLLFFKVGKFYELYELDAEVGHKELDWKLTVSGVGKCRQVGCPESGIDDAIQKLVSRGYKVGRMEQIETAEQARAKRGEKAMVQRELVQIITPSTVMDGNIKPEAVHLLALKEDVRKATNPIPGKADNLVMAIGFAFVDAAAGRFYVGSLSDDSSLINLKTLLTQVAPQEVLYESGGISKESLRALRRLSAPGLLPVTLTPLQPSLEFMEAGDTIRMLRSNRYFRDSSDNDWHTKGDDSWPTALKMAADIPLATCALGALVSHLTRMKCDGELLPNGFLCQYEVFKGSLRLDGQTVSNLELLENRDDGGKAGTLFNYLDSCVTGFGKRLLRRWICHPLRNIGDIHYRLDAVDELNSCSEMTCSLRAGLRKLPDLERLVARIRNLSFSPLAGIPTAAKKVHQRKLKAFFSTVLGVRAAGELLLSISSLPFDGNMEFKSKFLQAAAALPYPEPVEACLKELELGINASCKTCRLLKLQEGNSVDGDEEEEDWEARRLSQLIDMFNEHTSFWVKLVDTLGQLDVLISFASTINAANGPTCRPQLVPSPCLRKGGSVLHIEGLWHPYASGGQDGAFVPNDIELGRVTGSINAPRAMLLTGPNMGGKSTLLRATCLAVIMAQLGCYVPGEECKLSPVDTIFTRLGASDRIMAGESTFMVECNEAASVLHHATSDSLVILDELGRGTSTFDGYAIAYAVFHRLVNSLDCRLIFATHYHSLTEEFATNHNVSLRHMACSFQSRSSGKGGQDSSEKSDCDLDKELVFLYKLTEGASPKSFGLQVALRAGIPGSVVKAARKAANAMQESLPETFCSGEKSSEFRTNQRQLLQTILQSVNQKTGVEACRGKNLTYDLLQSAWQSLQCKAGSVEV